MDNFDRCFCELAPFAVLGLLDESEQAWMEAQIEQEPDRTLELRELEIAATAIPYSAPEVPMTADLKERLFQRVGLPSMQPVEPLLVEPESATATSLPQVVSAAYHAVRSQDLQWIPYRVAGVEIALLHIDEVKRQSVGVLRAAAGVRYPMHRHAGIEELYMLEGDLVVDGVPYGAGDYIRSQPGSVHGPETIGGCMFFFRACLDDEYPPAEE